MYAALSLQRTTPFPCLPSPLGCRFSETYVHKWTQRPLDWMAATSFNTETYTTPSQTNRRLGSRHPPQRHDFRKQQCSCGNMNTQRASAETHVKKGDPLIMPETDSTLWHDGVHRILVPFEWVGPWKVSTLMNPGLCFHVVINGRHFSERRTAV